MTINVESLGPENPEIAAGPQRLPELLDQWSTTQLVVVTLCFIVNMIDGMDVVLMSYIAPTILEDWAIGADQLGVVFSVSLLGMAIAPLIVHVTAPGFASDPEKFDLTSIVIGPQGVCEEARLTGTHLNPWLDYAATGRRVDFPVVIFFPWDRERRLFRGERVHFDARAAGLSDGSA